MTTTKTKTATPATPAATPAPAAAPVAKKDPVMYVGTPDKHREVPKSQIREAIAKKTKVTPEIMRAAEIIAFKSNGDMPKRIPSQSEAEYKAMEQAVEEWVKILNQHDEVKGHLAKAKGAKQAEEAVARAKMAEQRKLEKEATAKEKEAAAKEDAKFGEFALKSMGATDAAVNSSLESGINFLAAFGSDGVEITAQGAKISDSLSAKDSLAAMGKLVRGADGASKMVGNAFNFALGDLCVFHSAHHGENYTTFLTNMLEGTSLSLSHVRKLPTVAKAFPLESGVRYPNLQWGHFQEAISSSPEKKDSLTEKDGKTPISDKLFEKLNDAFAQLRFNVLKEAAEGDTVKTATGIVTKVKATSWVRSEIAKRKLALYKAYSEKAREKIAEVEAGGNDEGTVDSKKGSKKGLFILIPFEGAPIFASAEHTNMLDGNNMVIDVANGRYITAEDMVWTPIKDATKEVPSDWGKAGQIEAKSADAADAADADEEVEEEIEEEVEEETEDSSDEIDDLVASEDAEDEDDLLA